MTDQKINRQPRSGSFKVVNKRSLWPGQDQFLKRFKSRGIENPRTDANKITGQKRDANCDGSGDGMGEKNNHTPLKWLN